MPLSVTCTGCESVYPVGEALIGKTIRCKKCGEMIVVSAPAAAKAKPARVSEDDEDAPRKKKPARAAAVEDDEDDTPRKKPARAAAVEDDDDAPRKAKRPARVADDDEDDYDDGARKGKKKGAPVALIVGGVLGVLVLVGGGVGAVLAFGGKSSDTAQNTGTPPGPQADFRPAMGSPPTTTPAAVTPSPDKSPAAAQAPPKTNPAVAKVNPVSENTKPNTQSSTVPAVTTREPDRPTSLGMSQRDYMIGKMDRITLDKAKRAAVFIKVEMDKGIASGSGWFGMEPGMIITNAHVLGMKSPGSKEPKKITVFLNSGTDEQREIPHSRLKILAVDREIDLALLQVIGEKDLPVPLKVKPSAELIEGQGLTTLGFPFGSTPRLSGGQTKKEPELSVRPSTFTAPRKNEFGQTRRIQIEGGVYTGNSGGAVVDAEGVVVGVVVEVILDRLSGGQSQLGMAVPTEYVFGLLAGRIGEVEYKVPYREGGKVHIPVKVTCFDPLQRLSKVGIAGWVGDPSDKYRRPGTERSALLASDSDQQVVTLKMDDKTKPDDKTKFATGEIVLPDAPPGRVFWVQPFYSNSSTPEYWMPGIRLPVIGPPVDRVPADLIVKLRPGMTRSVTMSNSNDISEDIEGEGESKKERITLKTTLKVNEQVLAPDKNEYAARLRLKFEELGLKVETLGGVIEEDILPKGLIKMINDYAKLAVATGFVNTHGEMFRYHVDTLNIQDPVGKLLINSFGHGAMEALQATSIPIPNKRVSPGETWSSERNNRLFMTTYKIGKTGKPEPKSREYKFVTKMTYTYIGQRERAGKKEAVVMIEGKVSQAPGSKEKASGEMKGTALIELDTGIVLDADVENEFELDSSGDGLKKSITGIHKYKLNRGASAH